MENLKNIHPREILKKNFLNLQELPQIPLLRLSKYLRTSAKFWFGLQDDYDFEAENVSKKQSFEKTKPIENNAA